MGYWSGTGAPYATSVVLPPSVTLSIPLWQSASGSVIEGRRENDRSRSMAAACPLQKAGLYASVTGARPDSIAVLYAISGLGRWTGVAPGEYLRAIAPGWARSSRTSGPRQGGAGLSELARDGPEVAVIAISRTHGSSVAREALKIRLYGAPVDTFSERPARNRPLGCLPADLGTDATATISGAMTAVTPYCHAPRATPSAYG